jgi:hypothetical protein
VDSKDVLKKLRNLEARIRFNPGRHTYTLDGAWLPSVSSIKGQLDKPALTAWMVREQMKGTARACLEDPGFARRLLEMTDQQLRGIRFESAAVAEEHAILGTEVHALIEAWARRQVGDAVEEPEASDKAHFLFSDFLGWAGTHKVKVLAPEMRIASAAFRYCGTIDLLAEEGDGLTIFDWKTKSGDLYPEERLQLAAYRQAVKECTGILPAGRVLRIPKDGSKVVCLDADSGTTYEATIAVFLGLRAIRTWLDDLKKG